MRVGAAAVKPSRFIEYAERKLGRPLTHEEHEAVQKGRAGSEGRRAAVKAMRAALEAALGRSL